MEASVAYRAHPNDSSPPAGIPAEVDQLASNLKGLAEAVSVLRDRLHFVSRPVEVSGDRMLEAARQNTSPLTDSLAEHNNTVIRLTGELRTIIEYADL